MPKQGCFVMGCEATERHWQREEGFMPGTKRNFWGTSRLADAIQKSARAEHFHPCCWQWGIVLELGSYLLRIVLQPLCVPCQGSQVQFLRLQHFRLESRDRGLELEQCLRRARETDIGMPPAPYPWTPAQAAPARLLIVAAYESHNLLQLSWTGAILCDPIVVPHYQLRDVLCDSSGLLP